MDQNEKAAKLEQALKNTNNPAFRTSWSKGAKKPVINPFLGGC